MAADIILRTYGDSAIPEGDVMGLVEILTAKENYFLNSLPQMATTNTVDINLTDTLRTAATLQVEEAADYTYLTNTTPTRVNNIVQLVAAPYRVSLMQQWVDHYHNTDELVRQTTKRTIDWANAAEFDLVRSTLVSGASGTAPAMSLLSGLFGFIMRIYESMFSLQRSKAEQESEMLLAVLPRNTAIA